MTKALLVALALMVGLGCTGVGPAAERPGDLSTSSARKVLSISMEGEVNALATELDSQGVSGPSSYLHDFLHDYLAVRGDNDELLGQMAVELPSIEKGTWRVFPDGRMEVVWRLRPGILWHDGAEFTSADVKFGFEVSAEPGAPLGTGTLARFIETVETPDPHTAVFRWRQISRFAGEMGRSQINVLPRHLLEADFLANKEAFPAHPYFTSTDVMIGTGPFRTVEWARGSHLTAEAFDRYYQGRPKIGRITFRFIKDGQTVLANLLSGAVDMAYRGLSYENTLFIQREWEQSGAGTVLNQPTNYRHNLFQLRPELASPLDLLNPQVRRALIYGANREQIVEGIFPGVGAHMVAHSIAYPGTPIGDAVDRAIVRYPYDQGRALAILEDAGWRRGPDGMLAKPSGERFRVELNAGGGDEDDKTFLLMEVDYRRLGIELFYRSAGGGRRQTPEESVRFPGIQKTGLPFNQPTFGRRWHSSEIAGPENRFGGSNRAGYSNPTLDHILDELDRQIRFVDEVRYWADAWRIITDDAVAMGLFFVPNPIVVRKGVGGALPANASGSATWRAHTWDVQ